MAKLDGLEIRLREKYQFLDNLATRRSPSESILTGGVLRAFDGDEASKNELDILFKNPRLLNLIAMLWKACKTEFNKDLHNAKTAIATGILNSRAEPDIEKKAAIFLREAAKILPSISDNELAEIRKNKKEIDLMVQELDLEVAKRIAMGRSIFEDYSDEDEPAPSRAIKRLRHRA